jgi:hypothetical protein
MDHSVYEITCIWITVYRDNMYEITVYIDNMYMDHSV